MINLTPHAIIIFVDGYSITIQPSGMVARVSSEEVLGEPIDIKGAYVPVVTRSLGQVTGLPGDDTPCLVSSMVLAAVPGRPNTFAPDTGQTAIRDADGRIVAVTRLVAA